MSSNIVAGIMMPDFSDLDNHLQGIYQRPFFSETQYAAGFLGRGTVLVSSRAFDGHTSMYFQLPEKIQVHDSLSFQLSGWQFSYGIFGRDFLWFTEYVDLVISPGVVLGNFHIKRTDDDRRSRYANPYIAAKGAAELRFCFGKFSFGGRGEYLYDITDPKWKRKHGLMPVLPGSYYRGPQLMGFLGWRFSRDERKTDSPAASPPAK